MIDYTVGFHQGKFYTSVHSELAKKDMQTWFLASLSALDSHALLNIEADLSGLEKTSLISIKHAVIKDANSNQTGSGVFSVNPDEQTLKLTKNQQAAIFQAMHKELTKIEKGLIDSGDIDSFT